MNVIYTFNSINFKTYGVFVSGSSGILGLPPVRIETYDLPGESGHAVDLKHATFDVRTIELNCFIKAASVETLTTGFRSFAGIFQQNDVKPLAVSVGDVDLSFLVYLKKISNLKKTFSDGMNVGTFTLTFIEPDTSIYE